MVETSGEKPLSSHRGLLPQSLGWLAAGIWFLCQAVLISWATLAIYYSNLPWAGVRLALGAAFAAFTVSLPERELRRRWCPTCRLAWRLRH
jgi:hypothetical protein